MYPQENGQPAHLMLRVEDFRSGRCSTRFEFARHCQGTVKGTVKGRSQRPLTKKTGAALNGSRGGRSQRPASLRSSAVCPALKCRIAAHRCALLLSVRHRCRCLCRFALPLSLPLSLHHFRRFPGRLAQSLSAELLSPEWNHPSSACHASAMASACQESSS
jgi:hypothetical protein